MNTTNYLSEGIFLMRPPSLNVHETIHGKRALQVVPETADLRQSVAASCAVLPDYGQNLRQVGQKMLSIL